MRASRTTPPGRPGVVDVPLFRITLLPGRRTGLTQVSQVMLDKIVSVPCAAVIEEVGECSEGELEAVADGLRRWLSLP
jgi:mRNA-degrading endonuclease toxin of MazEF toxin-antitoxin module